MVNKFKLDFGASRGAGVTSSFFLGERHYRPLSICIIPTKGIHTCIAPKREVLLLEVLLRSPLLPHFGGFWISLRKNSSLEGRWF